MGISALTIALLAANGAVAPMIATEATLQLAEPVEQREADEPAVPDDASDPQAIVTGDLVFPPAPIPEPDVESEGIVITATPQSDADPLQALNIESFKATQKVDEAIVRPAAMAYKNSVPSAARDGLRNFFGNLHEPVVAVNYLLQLKPGKALETAGRFLINSTAGVAGLFDVAKKKPFRLPRRPNGLANTLGYYGVKPGPFFYLPLIGPTTLRDSLGNTIDGLFLPVVVGKPFTGLTYTLPTTVVRSLDKRVRTDELVTETNASANPYLTTREQYLTRRQEEIDNLHSRRRPIDPDVPPTQAPVVDADAPTGPD